MPTGVTSNAEALAQAFSLLRSRLVQEVKPANDAILTQTQNTLDATYGAHLAGLWDLVSVPPDPLEIAHLHVGTADPRVIGYEFGTRRHFIRTSQTGNPVLRFNWHDGESWFKWVNHPGTKPHNLRGEIEIALTAVALEEWRAVLAALFTATFS